MKLFKYIWNLLKGNVCLSCKYRGITPLGNNYCYKHRYVIFCSNDTCADFKKEESND